MACSSEAFTFSYPSPEVTRALASDGGILFFVDMARQTLKLEGTAFGAYSDVNGQSTKPNVCHASRREVLCVGVAGAGAGAVLVLRCGVCRADYSTDPGVTVWR